MNTILLNAKAPRGADEVINGGLIALIAIAIVLLLLLVIAALYGIAGLRRRNVVLKKVDYLIEDITYKSESLNVTVESLNKISNYAMSLDAVSKNGLKSSIKLISENRNYIYSILEKMRSDVESREKLEKKSTKKSTAKNTTKATPSKSKTNTTKKTTK